MRLTTTLIAAVLAVATAQAQTPAALQDYLDLGGVGEPAWRSEIFCAELWDHPEIPRSECVWTERWKYIEYPRHPEYVKLFDLAADPDEKMNLAEDPGHARVLAKLREHCSRTIKELLDDQTRTKGPSRNARERPCQGGVTLVGKEIDKP